MEFFHLGLGLGNMALAVAYLHHLEHEWSEEGWNLSVLHTAHCGRPLKDHCLSLLEWSGEEAFVS